jgi:HAE1 family hydrophobic/amphiphilic exporter-1
MNFIQGCINNPVKVSVGVILVALMGVLSMLSMPKQLVPDVDIPTITVETRWRGASPQEVERQIVQEQEEQLRSVEGLRRMNSESMDSMGRIILEFDVTTDLKEALVNVNTRLAQVPQYPVNADEPVVSTSNLSDRPIAWFVLTPLVPSREKLIAFAAEHPQTRQALDPAIRAHSAGLRLMRLRQAASDPRMRRLLAPILPAEIDIPKLRKFCEDVIEARLERVSGVSAANTVGGQVEELQVIVDPAKLAARQLTLLDVRRALQAQSADVSGGDFWEGKRRYVVRTLGQFRTPEQVLAVILARRNDRPVYLRDVATVRLGHKKPDGLTQRFGALSLAVNCSRKRGANVLEVMDNLRQAAAELNRGVLRQRGLQLEQVYDETDYIYSAINVVTENILLGGALTFGVLLVFLRSGRSTLIITLHILISTLGAFLVLKLAGRSLNVPSLGGLAFAVGMLVDNAIVMLENIYRRHELGEAAPVAAVRGAREVWGALLNASAVNLAVFLPILFVEEEAGQLFRDIALAISGSVAISLVVAVAVVPPSAARLLRGRKRPLSEAVLADANMGRGAVPVSPGPGEPRAATDVLPAAPALLRSIRRLTGLALLPLYKLGQGTLRLILLAVEALQQGLVLRLATVLALVAGPLAIAWALAPKVEYLPLGNRNLVIGFIVPPAGYNIEHMVELGHRIETRLEPYWSADPEEGAEEKIDYPAIADFFYVARGRNLFVGLRAAKPLEAARLVELVQRETRNIPGAIVMAKQASLFEQGLTAGRTVDVEITGPDIRRLVQLGLHVQQAVLRELPGAQPLPRPSLDLNSPEVHVLPRWEQAADLGVSADELGYIVDALIDGAYATDYYVGGTKIDLTIMGRADQAAHSQDLAGLPVAVPSGRVVPLASLAVVRTGSGPEQINHRETVRTITIQVTPPPQMPLEEAMQRIEERIVAPLAAAGALEGGTYQINLGGTADKLRETWRALRFHLLLAVLITYLLMAALFESWLYPLVIITSVPLGAAGGFAGLWLLNLWVLQPLDVLTMLGFVILVGTVVNNPILIVEQALIHIREEGMDYRRGVTEAVRTRVRPIFMTTCGGLIGLLPLVISPDAGSELYRGIGAVLLGGMLLSTLLTLLLVPALFSLLWELRAWLRHKLLGSPAEQAWTEPALTPELAEELPASLHSAPQHSLEAPYGGQRHAAVIPDEAAGNGEAELRPAREHPPAQGRTDVRRIAR